MDHQNDPTPPSRELALRSARKINKNKKPAAAPRQSSRSNNARDKQFQGNFSMPDGVEMSSYTHRVVRMPNGKTKSVTEPYYHLPAPGQVSHHQPQQQYGYPLPHMPGYPMFQQPYMGYANEHHPMSHTAPQDVPAFTPAPALALPAPKAKRLTTKNSGNGKAAETPLWDRATFDAIIGGKAPPVMPTPPAEENAATSTGPGPAFSNMAVPVTSTNEKVALSIKEEQSLRARPPLALSRRPRPTKTAVES